MNIADILFLFRNTQDITVLNINPENANIEELNVIAIEILSWLKLEHKRQLWQSEGKRTEQKPLHLNMQYTWCKYLKELLEFRNVFSDVLIIKGGILDFRDEVDESYRLSSRENAYHKYNPQKIL